MARFLAFAIFGFVGPITVCALAPAAETVSDGAADLFPFERVQLTDGVVGNLAGRLGADGEGEWFSFAGEGAARPGKEKKNCKSYPGDVEWPSESEWEMFGGLLGGDALIRTVPEAAVCFSGNGTVVSNSTECQSLTAGWGNSSLRIDNPTSIRSVLFQGMTCMPPTLHGAFLGLEDKPHCYVGGYPEYVVNVSTVAQIQLAVNFARQRNIRLVIKNTGHDFGAKSVGKGALSIWTHYLKDAEYYANYEGHSYKGPAVKLGAGIQVFETNELAKKHDITLVGGEGRTVGHIGGYIQGGGHSPLTSILGMGSDHVLSVSLVTAKGRFITADAKTNPDIFWAVCGGGGSTYGVVTSMVIKAYPKMKVTTMRYNMTTSATFTQDQFWEAQYAYVDDFAKYADLGYYCYYRIRHVGSEIFHDATSWVAPNTSEADFRASVAPMFKRWEEIGVPFTPIIKEYDNYPDAFVDAFPQEAWTVTMRQASRFFPRDNIENKEKRREVMESIRGVFDEGANMIMFNMRNPPGSANIDNAVNPAWRDILMFAIMFVTWNVTDSTEYVTQKSRNLTYEWNPRWKKLTPGGGTYMSESDYIEPDWQQSFHGDKYERLYDIKQQWDPEGVFYAQNAVGSEDWQMSEILLGHLPSQNSRLCRK